MLSTNKKKVVYWVQGPCVNTIPCFSHRIKSTYELLANDQSVLINWLQKIDLLLRDSWKLSLIPQPRWKFITCVDQTCYWRKANHTTFCQFVVDKIQALVNQKKSDWQGRSKSSNTIFFLQCPVYGLFCFSLSPHLYVLQASLQNGHKGLYLTWVTELSSPGRVHELFWIISVLQAKFSSSQTLFLSKFKEIQNSRAGWKKIRCLLFSMHSLNCVRKQSYYPLLWRNHFFFFNEVRTLKSEGSP